MEGLLGADGDRGAGGRPAGVVGPASAEHTDVTLGNGLETSISGTRFDDLPLGCNDIPVIEIRC